MEIERRFLVKEIPQHLIARAYRIEQGYLAIDDVAKSSVRVRRSIAGYVLTAKSGVGVARAEENVTLTVEELDRLWPLTEGCRVEKVRHLIPAVGLTYEADVFEGRHQGLELVEVEFLSEQVSAAFTPPDWFGREVTNDSRYTNAWLARYGIPT